jgi:hypothetical protein
MCTRSDLLRAWISYKMHTPHPASTACPRPARARSTTTGPGHAPPGPSHAPPYAVHLLLRHPAPLRASASYSGPRQSWAAAATTEGDESRNYDKVPMDTPGAYRLVDRATGRGVMVWGGTDMPSPAVLSRTTDRPKKGFAITCSHILLAANSVNKLILWNSY